MLNISIPQPCHEDWNAMTPTEKGAFCAVCTKEVMDFSTMSDDEVKNYFLLNAGKKTCGRFRKSQLKGLNIVVDEQVIYTNIALWKKFLAVVVICFGALLSSCTDVKGKVEGEMPTAVAVYPPDTVTHILGDTTLANDLPKPPMPGDPDVKIKEVTVTCEYIVGDIAPPVPIQSDPPREVMGVPEIEPMPLPKDTAKKVVDTCSNAAYL